jgi:hypothetical protein
MMSDKTNRQSVRRTELTTKRMGCNNEEVKGHWKCVNNLEMESENTTRARKIKRAPPPQASRQLLLNLKKQSMRSS